MCDIMWEAILRETALQEWKPWISVHQSIPIHPEPTNWGELHRTAGRIFLCHILDAADELVQSLGISTFPSKDEAVIYK